MAVNVRLTLSFICILSMLLDGVPIAKWPRLPSWLGGFFFFGFGVSLIGLGAFIGLFSLGKLVKEARGILARKMAVRLG